MRTEYRFDELDRLEKELLKQVQIKFPARIEQVLFDLANELVGATKVRTKVDTGTLRNAWRVSGIKKKGTEWSIEVYNNTPYAAAVEHGHETRNGGYVKGRKMLTISMKLLEVRLNQRLRKELEEILKEVSL